MQVKSFVVSPFAENMYILFDDTKECIIVDPGCYTQAEKDQVTDFIKNKNLKPIALINTHCHLDHVFGNHFIAEKYGLSLAIPQGEEPVLAAVESVCQAYGIRLFDPVKPYDEILTADSIISFGNTKLSCFFAPGHSPASMCFYHADSKQLIAGDVLFEGSIGRTDLPGGSHEQLLHSIQTKLYTLPNQTIVYPGHGAHTTIGVEKKQNPFVRG